MPARRPRAARPANAQELPPDGRRIVDDRLLEVGAGRVPHAARHRCREGIVRQRPAGVFHPRVQYPEGSLIEHRPENGCEAILEEAE